MINRLFKVFLFVLLGFFVFETFAGVIPDQVKCEKWGDKKVLVVEKVAGNEISSLAITIETSCNDDSYKSLSVVERGDGTRIGEFFMPYSHNYELSSIGLPNRNLILFSVNVSEPEPTNSYYYAIIDLDFKRVVYSGYSDSPVKAINIDNREGLEVIIGKNISGIDPLELLINYVPYPSIIGWGCFFELHVYDISYFPKFFTKYKRKLIEYENKLKTKKKEGLNARVQKVVDNEIGMIDMMLFRNRLIPSHKLKCIDEVDSRVSARSNQAK